MRTYRRETGGLVDRTQPVRFSFDGKEMLGFRGDTLASALLANGRHMVARSFKYHRPRGIVSAGAEEAAALVEIGGDTARRSVNVRVTEQEIYSGLYARSQNAWPFLDFDIGRINDCLWRFLPAGFYYKTFMGPPLGWMRFEPLIRAAAGLGRAPALPDPDRYEAVNRHCDVLVVGGGPAGLRAAEAASSAGARVIVCDENPLLGGSLLGEAPAIRLDGMDGATFAAEHETRLRARANVAVLTRTAAFGYYGENFIGLLERVSDHLPFPQRHPRAPRERLWRVRAREVVLATGAIERPIVFPDNDRPGIMLASAAQTYAYRYGVLPGRNIVVFANNDAAWKNAFALQEAGARIVAMVDPRHEVDPALRRRAADGAIDVFSRSAIVATKGHARVRQAEISPLDAASRPSLPGRIVDCDLIAVSGGYNPNVALFAQSRGQLSYDGTIAAFRPAVSWQNERSAGASNGAFGLAACLSEGERAGNAAALACGFDKSALKTVAIAGEEETAGKIYPLWEVEGRAAGRAWVDLQNDVTAKDLKLAVQEGYRSVEHVKRYTTVGMGTDQGKLANVNAFGILAVTMGKSIPEIGMTTYRQPYKPVAFGALAGQHRGPLFRPRRTTPIHDWHLENGAHFETAGDWLRAWVYPKPGEPWQRAVQREAKAARTAIGLLDASTLGKIDIQGRDARGFLNRIYTNSWTNLAPGRCRYGLMLKEDGMVFDDGVTACLADGRFHMTTTTGGAAAVLAHLEDYRQTEWPDLDVWLTSVTEEWAVASLCGPQSPKLMRDLFGSGFAPDEMPFMSMKEARLGGVPVRVFRISFTGEVSYEINIAASYGRWLWEVLMEKGALYGITPYGTETMHLLRAEKGFIVAGQETDGTVTPHDLRMGWIVNGEKGDFIGKRSLLRADMQRTDRLQFVGLLTEDGSLVAEEGAHIIETPEEPAPPVRSLGHVTSSYYSPNLNRSIALALIEGGGARIGGTVYITTQAKSAPIAATVTDTDFLKKTETR